MAKAPEDKVKKPNSKKPTVKKTVGAKAKKVPKKTAKPKAVKKPKTTVKNNNKAGSNDKNEKKDAPMTAKTETNANAKLEQTGNVADKVWRLIAMIAFAFIGNFTLFAIVVLSAMQFIVVLMEDKPNKEVVALVDKLTGYLKEIFSFLSYKTDIMPFPFSSFPKSD